jgi:hypothetical protein
MTETMRPSQEMPLCQKSENARRSIRFNLELNPNEMGESERHSE